MIARLCALLCVLIAFARIDHAAAASEPRVALVVGNSEYGPAIGKLKNPAADAKLVAETLKGLGFSVDLVLDADQKAMKRAVKSFGAKLRAAGLEATGLFYYAGHGVQVEGTNFLLPVGAEIAAEADVEIESIAADDVMTQMQSAGNAVNLVFLDACRNNPLARTSRSATRGLARLDAPRGSFVGYSTAPGDVAADGDGANSPYALALVDELKRPGISIEEAHRNVRARVLAETQNKQTPWDSSSLTGAVVLASKAPELPPPAIDKEVVFWESIKDSKDAADFDAYLSQYPQGTFAKIAQNKLAALKTASAPAPVQQATITQGAPPASQAEMLYWESIKESDDPLQIQAYLDKYPQGTFVLLAEAKLARLQRVLPAQESAATVATGARRLLVTAEVKAGIDKYVESCMRKVSRYCYIAVSKDGTKFGTGSFNTSFYYYEPEARREAVKNCGDHKTCEVIFERKSFRPGLDIVVR